VKSDYDDAPHGGPFDYGDKPMSNGEPADGGWGPWIRARLTWHNIERLVFLIVSVYTAVRVTEVKHDQDGIADKQTVIVKKADDAADKAQDAAVKTDKVRVQMGAIKSAVDDLWLEGLAPESKMPAPKGK
jgi:hypothetical protein